MDQWRTEGRRTGNKICFETPSLIITKTITIIIKGSMPWNP
jgi:hypothetical protein